MIGLYTECGSGPTTVGGPAREAEESDTRQVFE
jgi:hypothetical protein